MRYELWSGIGKGAQERRQQVGKSNNLVDAKAQAGELIEKLKLAYVTVHDMHASIEGEQVFWVDSMGKTLDAYEGSK